MIQFKKIKYSSRTLNYMTTNLTNKPYLHFIMPLLFFFPLQLIDEDVENV